MTPDVELLRLYATHRSQEAFAELVHRHIDFVYAVALRNVGRDEHLAHDVTQQVFTDLARKADELSRRAVIGGWLYRSTQFAAAKTVRSERRRRDREQEAEIMNEVFRSASPAPDWDRIQPLLDRAIGALDDADRDAVWLRVIADQPYSEVGARLGLSENAARMRVERALEKLQKTLARAGVTSTALAISTALANPVPAAPAGLAGRVATSAAAGASASGVVLLSHSFVKGAAAFFVLGAFLGGAARATLPTKSNPQPAVARWIRTAGETVGLVQPRTAADLAPVTIDELPPGASQIFREAGLHPAADDPPDNRPSWLYVGVPRGELFKSKTYVLAAAEYTSLLLDARFGPLYDELRLAPTIRDRVRQTLLEREMVQRQIRAESKSRPAAEQAIAESEVEYQRKLKALVADTDWPALERATRREPEFNAMSDRVEMNVRSDINRAGSSSELWREPLSLTQRDELTAAWLVARRGGEALVLPSSLSPLQTQALGRRVEISDGERRLSSMQAAAAEARSPGHAARIAAAQAAFTAELKAKEEAELKAATKP